METLFSLLIVMGYSGHRRFPAQKASNDGASNVSCHDDVIKWKKIPRYWPFVRGIHRPPVNSPHKGQWRGALMFSLICAWINGWVNNYEAGDLRHQHPHYDVIVMWNNQKGSNEAKGTNVITFPAFHHFSWSFCPHDLLVRRCLLRKMLSATKMIYRIHQKTNLPANDMLILNWFRVGYVSCKLDSSKMQIS